MSNKENCRYHVSKPVNGVSGTWRVYRYDDFNWQLVGICETKTEADELVITLKKLEPKILAAVREVAEAKAGKTEPENQGMNNVEINEIVGRYLAENPETAKRLVEAATQFEAEKKRRREAFARKMECVAAVKELDEAICVASDAVNRLKGDILRLQKERKAALAELEKASGACSAFGI